MNIRAALKTVLLPVCLTTTENMRKKLAEEMLIEQDPLNERAILAIKRIQKAWSDSNVAIALVEAMMIVAHGKESVKRLRIDKFLNARTDPVLDPMTVVKLVKDTSGHHQKPNALVLIYSGKNTKMIGTDGTHNWSYKTADYVLATDLEVETCIDQLSEAQIRFILSDTTVFAPVLASLLDTPDVAPTDGAKIEKESSST